MCLTNLLASVESTRVGWGTHETGSSESIGGFERPMSALLSGVKVKIQDMVLSIGGQNKLGHAPNWC